jgi:energy-coupling factor transporter transmembrane protein EcfT
MPLLKAGVNREFARVTLNSVVPAMGSGLSPIALMVVLAVIFVPAGHFLLFCLLLLLGGLVHARRFRFLLLLIEVLVLLCHVILLTRVMCDSAKKPPDPTVL